MNSGRNTNPTLVVRLTSGAPWGLILAIAAVYFGAAKLGLTMAFVAEQVTAVWPPSGIALAAVLVFGPQVWPGIAIGAFLANTTTGAPIAAALGIAVGNTLEATSGAWLLRRFLGFNPSLERLKDVLGLAALAAGLSTMVSATIGVASLCFTKVQPWGSYGQLWSVWWLGDATSDLVVSPLILTMMRSRRSIWPLRRIVEGTTLVAALAVVALGVFGGPGPGGIANGLAYSVFPFIIWAALRFRPLGSAVVTSFASAIAIWGTVRGLGPFAREHVHESLILIQLFMGVVAITGMFLAAAVAESRRAERQASAQHAAARILAESRTREEALRPVLDCVRRELEWDVAAFWIAHEQEDVLRLSEFCFDPSCKIPQFEAQSHSRGFARGVGLPGRVWATAQPAWLVDVQDDEDFPRIAAAAKEGLRGALAVPILLGGEVFGVMEFFSRGSRPPDEDILEMTTAIGRQIGQFIERRQAEEALRENEERLRLAMEAGEIGAWEWDVANDRVTWSDRIYAIHGMQPGTFGGRVEDFAELVHPDDVNSIRQCIRRALDEDAPYRAEFRILRPSGEVRWIATSAAVLRDERGRPLRMLGATIDTTERKQAEEALRESEEFRRRILDSTRDWVKVLALDGGFLSMNDAGLAALEIDDMGALVNTSWIDVWPVEEREAARRAVEAAAARGVGRFQGFFPTQRTHTPKWWDVVITPILDSGERPVQLLAVSRDVTDQKQMEGALRQADRRKDEFLAMLAHELRNPLSAISSAAELARQPQLMEQDRHWSQEVIRRQVKHLSRLIDDLLDISRITRGKVELRHESLDAGAIIEQAVDAVRSLIAERGHLFDLSVMPGALPVIGDATRIEQIVVNLLTNAAKYTESGGNIWLTAGRSGAEIIIKVRDTGIGIPPEKIAEKFELFAQGDRSLARSEGGLGIGHTLVKRLTELHGGSVTAHSEGPGKGSEFVVRLPLAQASPVEVTRAAS
jgi:PAS domain S-box-containing protein